MQFTKQEQAEIYAVLNNNSADANSGPAPVSYSDMLKIVRNYRLRESDWTQLPDVTLSNIAEWNIYRQALRDIPAQEGFPRTVVWPIKPE